MFKRRKILAVIAARGGSKGLPAKNIRPFCGKPLIAWTVEQAKKSRHIDKVVVSTDTEEIADIARRFQADVPFLRPKHLSSDTAKSIDVVLYTLRRLAVQGESFDLAMLLQPTSPLRKTEDIDSVIQTLFKKRARAVISVSPADHPPSWSNVLPRNKSMKYFMNKSTSNSRRNSFGQYYQLNGAVYLGYRDYLEQHNSFLGPQTFAYVMPKERSMDIDDLFDFKMAEAAMKLQRLSR